MQRDSRGFALLAVLWVMVGVAALGLAVSLATRSAIATTQHRANLARAEWRAHGCLERARAAIADALVSRPNAWRSLNDPGTPVTALYSRAPGTGHQAPQSSRDRAGIPCEVQLRAAGTALDLNTADARMLRALLIAAGIPAGRADSLTDALLDWRDPDDIPRPLGAEFPWYQAENLYPPRNARLADVRELNRVRGWSTTGGLDSLVTVEPGRISLANAPLAVLASLPGIGNEAVSRIAERRLRQIPVTDLIALAGELSPAARDTLLASYADLVGLTAPEPEAWIVTSRAREGSPPVTAVIELRLVRAGERAAIVRRRTWIE